MHTLTLDLFIGATLSGVGIVIALVAGYDTLPAILGAALAGFLVAFPPLVAYRAGHHPAVRVLTQINVTPTLALQC